MSRLMRSLLLVLAGLCATAAMAAVDANRATAAQLQRVKGMTPALVRAIVQTRQKAPFTDWAGFVARVPGMREATAVRLSAGGLTVQGALFVGFEAQKGLPNPQAQARLAAEDQARAAEDARVMRLAEQILKGGSPR